MQVVIDIPEEVLNSIKTFKGKFICENGYDLIQGIKDGTPLPKGHGDLIDRELAVSGDGLWEFHRYDDYVKMRNYLKSIPTIIEADKAESEE